MKRTGPTNINLRRLISSLKKSKSKLWKRVAEELGRPARQRREVNLGRLNRAVKDNDTVIIPGKILSEGELKKKITISALNSSQKCAEKIKVSGSKIISITELFEKNPEGKKVKLIG